MDARSDRQAGNGLMDARSDRQAEPNRSSESSSLSDFDKGFCTDHSMSLSVASSDALLKPSKGIVLEYSEPNPTVLPRLNYSISILSPLVSIRKSSFLSPGNSLTAGLGSPVEGKSSTPYESVKLHKPILTDSLDLSCVDLTTTHPSWEVSLVKPVVESPKSCLESTWSPINPSAPPDVSPTCSGTSPRRQVSEDLQRSWKEMVLLRSAQALAEVRDDERQSFSNLAI